MDAARGVPGWEAEPPGRRVAAPPGQPPLRGPCQAAEIEAVQGAAGAQERCRVALSQVRT